MLDEGKIPLLLHAEYEEVLVDFDHYTLQQKKRCLELLAPLVCSKYFHSGK